MNENIQKFHSGFVAIVGRPNVGKSTLLNQVLGQKIAITSGKPQTTRNRILGIHHFEGGQILFLDTPGIHQGRGKLNRFMVDQALSAMADVDVLVFVVEADDRLGGGDDYILKLLSQHRAPVILVINKIDKIPRQELLPLIAAYAKRFSFQEVIPLSALKGEGVADLVSTIGRMLPEGPEYFPGDMITDLPERFIVAEFVREQVLKKTRDEIPYGVAVTVDSFTENPDTGVVVIQAVIHVERDGHKRIVVGKGGAVIRSIGIAARKDIEQLLDTRVFLELFVRVDKDWTGSPRLLSEFGYD